MCGVHMAEFLLTYASRWGLRRTHRRTAKFHNPVLSLEKKFSKPMVLMESVYSECVPFGVLTHQMPTTQNGGTPNTKILCSENSFDPSYAT